MRNTAIFATLFLGILAVVWLQLERPTRRAVVEGRFTEEFRVRSVYAYLVAEDGEGNELRLDSCLIRDNRFTLETCVRHRKLAARIRIARHDFERRLTLRPGREVALTIRPFDWRTQYAEAVEEAIARLDSAGLTLPDSLWQGTAGQ